MLDKRLDKWLKVGEWILSRRWQLIILISLSIFTYELIEHWPLFGGTDANLFFELLLYGLLIPFGGGLVFSQLVADRTELAWLNFYQNLGNNLGVQLQNANSYEELANILLQFSKVVMPLTGAAIFAYDQQSHSYKHISSLPLQSDSECLETSFSCDLTSCSCLPENLKPEQQPTTLQPCHNNQIMSAQENSMGYCFPFLFSGRPTACAIFYLPRKSPPTSDHVRLLADVSPLIAAAFHRKQLEDLMRERDDSVDAEQKRIARDVHDTLGHSLAYLRLRLDQISTTQNQNKDALVFQRDVENLREVAQEAYDQMRNVLVTLAPENDSSLNLILMKYADKISHRFNFKLMFHYDGEEQILPYNTRQNIFYIFQETLTNIGKHAKAKQVDVTLNWQPESFQICVKDDGEGFESDFLLHNGHFGLKNMRARAKESNAKLEISSHPGDGTHIMLHVPYNGDLCK